MRSTKSLDGQYQYLTAEERFPLIAAAAARGDELDRRRLADSAPTRAWALPDYHGISMAVADLTRLFVMEQLGNVTRFLFAHWWIAFFRPSEEEGEEVEEEFETHRRSLRLAAYRYVTTDAAWRRFCEEKSVDPKVLTTPYLSYLEVVRCDCLLHKAAPTVEEATELLRKQTGDPEAMVMTVDQLLVEWRRAYMDIMEKWR